MSAISELNTLCQRHGLKAVYTAEPTVYANVALFNFTLELMKGDQSIVTFVAWHRLSKKEGKEFCARTFLGSVGPAFFARNSNKIDSSPTVIDLRTATTQAPAPDKTPKLPTIDEIKAAYARAAKSVDVECPEAVRLSANAVMRNASAGTSETMLVFPRNANEEQQKLFLKHFLTLYPQLYVDKNPYIWSTVYIKPSEFTITAAQWIAREFGPKYRPKPEDCAVGVSDKVIFGRSSVLNTDTPTVAPQSSGVVHDVCFMHVDKYGNDITP